jgi:hypothetical protein
MASCVRKMAFWICTEFMLENLALCYASFVDLEWKEKTMSIESVFSMKGSTIVIDERTQNVLVQSIRAVRQEYQKPLHALMIHILEMARMTDLLDVELVCTNKPGGPDPVGSSIWFSDRNRLVQEANFLDIELCMFSALLVVALKDGGLLTLNDRTRTLWGNGHIQRGGFITWEGRLQPLSDIGFPLDSTGVRH